MSKIGLLAGYGRLPIVFAKVAKAKGDTVIAFALKGTTDEDIKNHADKVHWLNWGDYKKALLLLTTERIKKIIMLGKIEKDIIFKEDFDSMQKQYPKLRVSHVLCEQAPGFPCTIGVINSGVIKKEIPDYALRKFYICGPPSMVSTMKNILTEELLLPEGNIVSENFQGY